MFGKKTASRRVQVISAYGQTWRDDEYDDDEYEDDKPQTMEKKSTQSGQCMICSAVYENDYGIKKHRCIMCRKQVCSRCCTGVDPVCTECMPAMGGGRGVANFVAPPARRSPPSKSPGRQMKAPPAPPPSVSKKNQAKKQGSLFGFGRKSPGPSPPKAMPPPKKPGSFFGFGRKSPGPSPPKEAPKKRIAPPKKKSPPPSPLPPKKAPPMKTNGKVNSLESELQKLMADTAGRNPTIGERDRIKELMLQLKDDESTDKKSSAKIPPRAPAAAFKKPAPYKKAAPAKQKSPPAFLNKKPAPRLPAAKPVSKPWNKKKPAPTLPPKKPASKPWNKKAAPTLPPKKPASKPWNKKAPPPKKPASKPWNKKPAPKKPASKTWNKKPAPKKPPPRPMQKFNSGPTPPKFSKPSVPKSKRTSKTFKLGSRGFKSPFSKKPPPKPTGKSKPGVKTGSVKDAIARRNKLEQEARSAPKTSASRWK